MNDSNEQITTWLILPVWGREHLDFALRYSIPTLLAPNNIPAMLKYMRTEFVFICPRNEVNYIRSFPAYLELSKIIPCRFFEQPPIGEDGYRHSYDRFTAYYNLVVSHQDVVPGKTGFLFLTADIMLGDGSLATLASKVVDEGYRAILVPGPRATLETFLDDYSDRLNAKGSPLNNRELAGLFLNNIHEITRSFIVGEPEISNDYPIHYYERINSETLVFRNFVYHPLYLRPLRKISNIGATIDHILIPESVTKLSKLWFALDSDELFCITLAETGYDQGYVDRRSKNDIQIIRAFRNWLKDGWATGFHLWLATKKGIIHSGEITEGTLNSSYRIDKIVQKIYKKESFTPSVVEGADNYFKLVVPWVIKKRRTLLQRLRLNVARSHFFPFRIVRSILHNFKKITSK